MGKAHNTPQRLDIHCKGPQRIVQHHRTVVSGHTGFNLVQRVAVIQVQRSFDVKMLYQSVRYGRQLARTEQPKLPGSIHEDNRSLQLCS